ncbi:MAG: ABC transporter ATP-binding protein [Atopobiaceae bacterium]|nr:ABC transporter ATP-binding protein [Atopobiaceae bacterium]
MVFNIASERFNSLKEYFIAMLSHELRFKEFRALDHISFEVKRGEAFGLVGTNGSGKSTMLKIIAGVLDATEGSCQVVGSIAPLIELGAGFDAELTAAENIYLNGALLGYKREFIEEHFDDIVEFAELEGFMDMPLKNYSSGMVARIAFAIATVAEPDVLIVDETLSVGDFLFQKKCQRRIKQLVENDNVTVLLVSHSIDLVEHLCDRVCWIEKGEMRMLGPTEEVCNAYKSLEK